jgi:hypothetical protein
MTKKSSLALLYKRREQRGKNSIFTSPFFKRGIEGDLVCKFKISPNPSLKKRGTQMEIN